MITAKMYLKTTMNFPGLGNTDNPAPASGHGRAMPIPRAKGTKQPYQPELAAKSRTLITTGATHAPARTADNPPITSAVKPLGSFNCAAFTRSLDDGSILNTPAIASDIHDYGIMLTGGCALMPGMDIAIRRETGLRVTVAEHPRDCVIHGLGRILKQPTLWGTPLEYRLK